MIARTLSVVLALLTLTACERHPQPARVSSEPPTATATVAMDENVKITSEPTGSPELDRLDSMRKQMAAIDLKFPRPAAPSEKPPTFRVVQVEQNGLIHIQDGRSLVLEGVRCSPAGMVNLKKMTMAPATEIAFIRPQPAELRGTPANLWLVDALKVEGRSVYSYSLITETALTSGWCRSLNKGEPGFNPRYAALEALAKKKAE